MRFNIRWPDQSTSSCYSPSLVVKEFLTPGESYSIPDFLSRSREALTIASERVKQKYGFYCTGAAESLRSLEETAAEYADNKDAVVTVLSFD
jgi:uncharacterized repeat protein (TIGR04042 family)